MRSVVESGHQRYPAAGAHVQTVGDSNYGGNDTECDGAETEINTHENELIYRRSGALATPDWKRSGHEAGHDKRPRARSLSVPPPGRRSLLNSC